MSTLKILPDPVHIAKASDSKWYDLYPTPPIFPNALYRTLAFARIECHFFVHGGWMRDGQLIEEAHKIAHLPIVIIQGRYDVVCPVKTSWDLYQALGGEGNKGVEYRIVDDAGHLETEKGIQERIVDAAEKFKSIKA
jgi:proline iminopeptidase